MIHKALLLLYLFYYYSESSLAFFLANESYCLIYLITDESNTSKLSKNNCRWTKNNELLLRIFKRPHIVNVAVFTLEGFSAFSSALSWQALNKMWWVMALSKCKESAFKSKMHWLFPLATWKGFKKRSYKEHAMTVGLSTQSQQQPTHYGNSTWLQKLHVDYFFEVE